MSNQYPTSGKVTQKGGRHRPAPVSRYKTDNQDWTLWSDTEFLDFIERHVTRPGALFNVKMLVRLYTLAQVPDNERHMPTTSHVSIESELGMLLVRVARQAIRLNTGVRP